MNNMIIFWYASIGLQIIYLSIYLVLFLKIAFRNSIQFHNFKKKLSLFNIHLEDIDYLVGGLILLFQITLAIILGFEPRFRWLLFVNLFMGLTTISTLVTLNQLSKYNRSFSKLQRVYSSVYSKVAEASSIKLYTSELKGIYEDVLQFQMNMLAHLNQISTTTVDHNIFKEEINVINNELKQSQDYIGYVNTDLINAFNKELKNTINRSSKDNESFEIKSYDISKNPTVIKDDVIDKIKQISMAYVIDASTSPNDITLDGYKHIIELYKALDESLSELFYPEFLKYIHDYQGNHHELLSIFLKEELIPLNLITKYFIIHDVAWAFEKALFDFYNTADQVQLLRSVIEHDAMEITRQIIHDFTIESRSVLHQALMKKYPNNSFDALSLLYHFMSNQKVYSNYPNGLEHMALSLLNYTQTSLGLKNVIKSIFFNDQRQLLEGQSLAITTEYESTYNKLFMRTKYTMLLLLDEVDNTRLDTDESINPELLLPFYAECVANLRADDLRVFLNVVLYFLFISVSTENDFERLMAIYKQDKELFTVEIEHFDYHHVYQVRDLLKKSLTRPSIRHNLTRVLNEIEFKRLLIKRFIA